MYTIAPKAYIMEILKADGSTSLSIKAKGQPMDASVEIQLTLEAANKMITEFARGEHEKCLTFSRTNLLKRPMNDPGIYTAVQTKRFRVTNRKSAIHCPSSDPLDLRRVPFGAI